MPKRALTPKQQRFVPPRRSPIRKPDAKVSYVYGLIDPRNNAVFYVGKGRGDRRFQHVMRHARGKIDNARKFDRITDIHAAELEVGYVLFGEGLSDTEATMAERSMIEALRSTLTNHTPGHRSEDELIVARMNRLLAQKIPYGVWVAWRKPEDYEKELWPECWALAEQLRDEALARCAR